MRKSLALPYILLGVFLVVWVNLPKSVSEALRGSAVHLFHSPSLRESVEKLELERLQLYNQQLRAKLEMACEWLAWQKGKKEDPVFFDKQKQFVKTLFDLENTAIPARVIYRDPSSWGSSLWVRAGEEDNRILGKTVVAKNSPVVSGLHLIGVIDYVGKTQSRVRLITDSGVVPAVRAVRGGAQNREIASLCKALCQRLESREDLKNKLESLMELLQREAEDLYLAKGELHGSSAPFWRSRSLVLRGEGFNYEYGDEHGNGRDLRSNPSLLKEGDLLITSGLDGVFPEGLTVGYVVSVDPLKQGAYAYGLTARPAVGRFEELKIAFILPPLSAE